MRKGQISIFVIVGLMLVLIVGVSIMLRSDDTPPQQGVGSSSLRQVTNYVEICMEQTTQEAIDALGQQGRLYPSYFIEGPQGQKVAYFYYQGDRGLFPTSRDLEEDISQYIKEHLTECLDYSTIRIAVTDHPEEMKVNTEINRKEIFVRLDYPVDVRTANARTRLSDFSVSVASDISSFHDVSHEIFTKTEEQPDWLDMEFLVSQPYDISLRRVRQDIIIYEINGDEYSYRFAVRYDL